MSKDDQESKGIKAPRLISAEAIDTALIQILSIFFPPIGSALSTVQSALQIKQQRMFEEKVKQRFDAIEQTKLDRAMLESDELISLVFQAVEAVSRRASESKCIALANALVSSIQLPTSQFRGKEAILRLIAQMSDEERSALAVIWHVGNGIAPDDSSNMAGGVNVSEIARHLGWSEADAVATCEGLLQLGLTFDAWAGAVGHSSHHHQNWSITALGDRVIRFSAEFAQGTKIENYSDRKRP